MTPIGYTYGTTTPQRLILGFHGEHVDFDWRPYHERTFDAQQDYDRLLVSLFHHGQKCPLITFYDAWKDYDHVLIGQRRAEILQRFREPKIMVARIGEDPTTWTRDDIPRLEQLKKAIGEVNY